jgi:predicted Rossmann-fold nucleotide-binding protein
MFLCGQGKATNKDTHELATCPQGPDVDNESIIASAEQLGRALAEAGYVVLTGGRSRGVMDAACRGARVSEGSHYMERDTIYCFGLQ